MIFDGANLQSALAQQEKIPLRRMQIFLSLQAAGVGPFAAGAINAAPALRRTGPPRQPGRFAVTLKIHDEGKYSGAQPSQEVEELAGHFERIAAAQRRAVNRDDFIHITKTMQ